MEAESIIYPGADIVGVGVGMGGGGKIVITWSGRWETGGFYITTHPAAVTSRNHET